VDLQSAICNLQFLSSMKKPLISREKVILAAIVALAAFFRLYQLDKIPPGFQFDQAYYVFDVLRLLQGQFYLFFAAPGGTEPLYIYLAMPGVALAGITPLGLKVTTAVIGLLTIPLIYGLARTMFSSESEGASREAALVGLVAAFLSAVSIWHIFFNRYGERVTLLVLLTVMVYLFWWRALSHSSQSAGGRSAMRAYAIAGLFLALALYTYPGARVLPIGLIPLSIYAALTDRANAMRYIRGLGLAFVVAAIVFLPLGAYFIAHPSDFIGHTADVSIFVPHGEEQGDIVASLARNGLHLLGMFFIAGDPGMIRNVPNRPIFDPLTAILFIFGVIISLLMLLAPRSSKRERTRVMFLWVWIIVALGVSLFSDDAPNFVRTLPAMPAVMILPAWGAMEIWKLARTPVTRRGGAIALGVILLAATGSSYHDYFDVFAHDPGLYYAFTADKVEIADWINQHAGTETIFLAPVTYQVSTVSLLTRNAALKSFESRDTIVLPSRAQGKDAIFSFPPEQEGKVETLASRLGSLGARSDVTDSQNLKLLLNYRVPHENLPDPQNPLDILSRGGSFIQPQIIERANWSNQVELLGYTLDPGTGGRNPTIILFLRSLEQMSDDYTFSIKVRDEKNRVWGQEDKWTGDNSYETSHWGVGDLVIEKFYPGLNPCAPIGDYHLSVEAYNPKTGEVLGLSDRDGNAVQVGTVAAGTSTGNRVEDLEPDVAKEIRIDNGLQLLGYTLTQDQLHVGDSFSLSLFWRGVGKGESDKVSVRVGDVKLLETTIQVPEEGRGVCTFYDLTAPPSLAPGAGAIWVNDTRIASVQVVK
jgi:hypothetical protein